MIGFGGGNVLVFLLLLLVVFIGLIIIFKLDRVGDMLLSVVGFGFESCFGVGFWFSM